MKLHNLFEGDSERGVVVHMMPAVEPAVTDSEIDELYNYYNDCVIDTYIIVVAPVKNRYRDFELSINGVLREYECEEMFDGIDWRQYFNKYFVERVVDDQERTELHRASSMWEIAEMVIKSTYMAIKLREHKQRQPTKEGKPLQIFGERVIGTEGYDVDFVVAGVITDVPDTISSAQFDMLCRRSFPRRLYDILKDGLSLDQWRQPVPNWASPRPEKWAQFVERTTDEWNSLGYHNDFDD